MLIANNSKNAEEREIHKVEATGYGELLDMRGTGMGKLIDDSNISDLRIWLYDPVMQ